MNIRTFHENVFVQKVNAIGTGLTAAARYPVSGAFIDVSKFVKGVFMIFVGGLDTETTFDVYQDTSATETANIKKVAGTELVIAAGDDEKWATIEFDVEHLDIGSALGYHYVTLVPSGAAGANDFFAAVFLGMSAGRVPVIQPASYAQAIDVSG